jgi:PAS domain S-box-containing protein
LPPSRLLYSYIFLVFLLGLSAGIYSLVAYPLQGDVRFWILFAILAAASFVSNRYPIQVAQQTNIDVGTIPLFSAILLFNPAGAMLIAALQHVLPSAARKEPWFERLFNAGQTLLYTGAGIFIFQRYSTIPWQPKGFNNWIALVMAIIVMSGVNLALTTGVMSLAAHLPFFSTFRKILIESTWEHLVMYGVAILGALLILDHPWSFVIMLLVTIAVNLLVNRSRQSLNLLNESENRYQGLFQHNLAPILIISPGNGKIIDVNRAACTFYGYDRDFFLTLEAKDLQAIAASGMPLQQKEQGVGDQEHFFVRHLLANGDVRDLEVYSGPIPVDGKTYLYQTLHDVTERQQAQRRAQVLSSISQALQAVQGYEDVLNVLIDQICDHMDSDSAALILLQPDQEQLSVTNARGAMAKMASRVLPSKGGLIASVLATGQPSINELKLQDNFLNMFVDLNAVLFSACIPMSVQDEKVGVLWLGRTRVSQNPLRYSPEEIALLTAVGEMSANAIHRAGLLEQTRRYAEQMKAITQAGDALVQVLEISDIYESLDQSLLNLFPDICGVLISSFDSIASLIKYEFGIVEGNRVDIFRLPMLKLDAPGNDAQSDAIHTYKPVIANHLQQVSITGTNLALQGTSGNVVQSILYAPMIGKGELLGVIQVHSHSPNRFSPTDAELLTMIGNIAAVAIENARLIDDLEHKNVELVQSYDATIDGWSNAVELRDQETEGHQRRVAHLTTQLAVRMGLNVDQLEHIRRGAMLHDVGKIGIPDNILNKPGKLTEPEWEVMKRHPQYAYDLLRPVQFLRPAIEIPYCHHEKWDGTGYPRGLKGEEIPMTARIFAVIDVWDALRSNRPYRKAWGIAETAEYMQNQSGRHFDPSVLTEFFKMMNLDAYLETNEKATYP